MVGSLRLRFVAIWDRRRSLGIRFSLGDPLLLAEERREISAAFMLAVAARDVEERRTRGEGEFCCLSGSERAACVDRGWTGEDAMDREGGSELRSGGIMKGESAEVLGKYELSA